MPGYKDIRTLSDPDNPLLQHLRAGESIQDKSLDARLKNVTYQRTKYHE